MSDGDSLDERAARTAQILLDAAQKTGIWISPDLRIGVDDGATLIGMTPRGFKKRVAGTDLRTYQVGGARHKHTIRLFDLAAWLESQSEKW